MKKHSKKSSKLRGLPFSFKKRWLAVMIVFLAVIGWVSIKVLAQKYVTTTDSTGHFSYKYPEDWTLEPYKWVDCCEGPSKTEPDWTKESKPIILYPNADKEAKVTIEFNDYSGDYVWTSYDGLKKNVKDDYFAKILFDGTRDDGHKALFSRVDYLGPPDAKVESFTDHRYYFDDNDKRVLRVEFREKYHHDWPDDEMPPDTDNSRFLADYEYIAKSIKFTK